MNTPGEVHYETMYKGDTLYEYDTRVIPFIMVVQRIIVVQFNMVTPCCHGDTLMAW